MKLLSPPQAVRQTSRAAVTLIALAALVALLYYGRDFFVTLIISAIFAFILDPAVVLVMKLRVPRAVATATVIGIALVAVYLLSVMAWSQVSTISEDLPAYAQRVGDLWEKSNAKLDEIEQRTVNIIIPKKLRPQNDPAQRPQSPVQNRKRRTTAVQPTIPVPPVIPEFRLHTDPPPVITTIYGYLSGYVHLFVMASFVPFLVYFMLSWRDHISKGVMRLFDEHDRRVVVGRTWSGIGDSTRAYVLGNFLLWVFLSSISAIAFFFLGIPYWPLIGPLSAFFSLAPYVGALLCAIPPVMAAIAVPSRFKIIFTAAAIAIVLHFIGMNVLYAKIIGRRVRLNPLVVTIALMFWGVVWGGIGLVLAVPITAALKTVCDNVESLQPYGKLLGD